MTNLSGPVYGLTIAVSAAVVLVPGVMMVIRRRDPLGLCLSFVGSGVVTALVGVVSVIIRTPARPWFFAAVPLVYVIGMFRLGRLKWATRWGGNQDRVALLGSAIVGLSAAVFLVRAPVGWDARSIWFFHASWFANATTVYGEFPLVERFPHAHTDYPPLTASFGAFAWLFGDPLNDWIVQSAAALITLSAIGVLSIMVSRATTSALGRALAAGATTFAALAVIRGNGLNGHVDGLVAVLVSTLAIVAFRRDDPPLVLIAAVALALAKNEGYAFLVVVIFPLYLFRGRSVRPLLPGLGIGLIWAVAIRAAGPALESWQPFNALPWSPDFGARFDEIVRVVLSDPMLLAAMALWAGALLLVFAKQTAHNTRVTVGGMGAVAGALLLAVVTMYLATPHDALPRNLGWHLFTSADRLVMHPALVLVTGAIYGIVAGWSVPISRTHAGTPVTTRQ